MANHWSESEVEAAVQDYFSMLRLELSGVQYNKTEHRKALIDHLDDRSHGAIELKHQNISAALIDLGMPYIDGYKPRINYQKALLPVVIKDYIERNPDILELFKKDSELVPVIPSVSDFLSLLESPPVAEKKATKIAETRAVYIPNAENYLEIEAQKQMLGDAGEQFVINFEKARLIRTGKESLADRIEQVSVTEGPSAGFDIRSYEEDGTDRYIEAKTTKYGKNTPFYVTPNELRFSQENSARYHLYRVFRFRNDPKMFVLPGNLEEQCSLKPSEYVARVG